MKDKPLTFTRFQGFSSLATLMACARESYFMGEFIEKAAEFLPQQSKNTKREMTNDFIRIFLRFPIPKEDPVVLFWNYVRSERTRKEIALIQIMRAYPIVDRFVSEFLYSILFSRVEGDLFHREKEILTNKEINAFLLRHLSDISPSTFRSTRNTLRSLLVQSGLLLREEKIFPSYWEVEAYRPTFAGWLFAITVESEIQNPLKISSMRTPFRFLMDSRTKREYLKASEMRGWGKIERNTSFHANNDLIGLIKEISEGNRAHDLEDLNPAMS